MPKFTVQLKAISFWVASSFINMIFMSNMKSDFHTLTQTVII